MKIVGDSTVFSIEYNIDEVFPEPSLIALGYFAFHIGNQIYGVRKSNTTMLACSLEGIKLRIKDRGKHFSELQNFSANELVSAYRAIFYEGLLPNTSISDLDPLVIEAQFLKKNIVMAPDGDAAFDDGGHVFQFDCGDKVRLVSFINSDESAELSNSIVDITLDEENFYGILDRWIKTFETDRLEKLNALT